MKYRAPSAGPLAWSTGTQPYEPTNGSDDWNVSCTTAPHEPPVEPNRPGTTTSVPRPMKSLIKRLTAARRSSKPDRRVVSTMRSYLEHRALLWQTQVGLGPEVWNGARPATENASTSRSSDFLWHPLGGGYAGAWVALDPATGNIRVTPDPNGAVDLGRLAVVTGVARHPSTAGGATQNDTYALNAANGNIVWSYASGGFGCRPASGAYRCVLGVRLHSPADTRVYHQQQVVQLLPQRKVTTLRAHGWAWSEQS